MVSQDEGLVDQERDLDTDCFDNLHRCLSVDGADMFHRYRRCVEQHLLEVMRDYQRQRMLKTGSPVFALLEKMKAEAAANKAKVLQGKEASVAKESFIQEFLRKDGRYIVRSVALKRRDYFATSIKSAFAHGTNVYPITHTLGLGALLVFAIESVGGLQSTYVTPLGNTLITVNTSRSIQCAKGNLIELFLDHDWQRKRTCPGWSRGTSIAGHHAEHLSRELPGSTYLLVVLKSPSEW
ncbi:hypothetical protein KVT40_004056 [Elsinoe batatas]|uniref:Uncharacterized protein n=1 Tax=Elsinoe batatas TaxID=2601811 RepID=A0A8K0PI75_9PEZI|nr:hypothetical protein KVT40_004056 [Elsinoe batatas]